MLIGRINKTCRTKALLQISDGNRLTYKLVSKDETSTHVELPNADGTTSMWPIDRTCIRTTSYPIGFVPDYLKREIDVLELDAETWEPVFSSKHASGEVVASPRLLGIIFGEKVSQAVVSLGKEITDKLSKIAGGIQPMYFWISIITLAILDIITMVIVIRLPSLLGDLTALSTKLDVIIKLLGGS
jgi:hypothetical protein